MIFETLPESMKNEYTKEYVEILNKRKFSLFLKRVYDVVVSLIILTLLSPFFLLLAIAIKLDSKGPVFYRQTRVGRYNTDFKIFKFRTMVLDADKIGPPLTVGDDPRITRMGRIIRKLRLDEFSQLLNVLNGSMSLVGPRPEVRKYVEAYTPEYMATLLIRPGITATSSIAFKDEDRLLNAAENPEQVYIEQILPPKMAYNLEYMKNITLFNDIKIMFQTVGAVLK
ncbi:UDP-N-acetylgalactosamine-undecaprenyl-phosphate N-acetylgalactosaminephosphotransferase [Caproiciproducens galactitolivorans]|uniref:UDP-N-acetylgalactosamine-undecaprenyl-phosphate N-acetylgalactosaminephosphotransferase n=2 Tax=Caproiciproducens galactitolivorans TaxID=642589 RepID=A0A4Z0Y1P1_9FIRM|nr:UDP-N-acetylgalactosamine-undecaprenyl-phosphate N-acetylgalactosaminephosphotransferase [Caproiciproducens galactitolivorans]